jgi:uncharacterized membrane-anchored protein
MSTTWELRLSPMLNKVPEVTLIFWTSKILSTTVGETGADYLVHAGLGANLTMACMAGLLIAALILQLRASLYSLDLPVHRGSGQHRRNPDYRFHKRPDLIAAV